MEINNWKEFKVGGLFELERGKCSKVVGLLEGDIPYVGCTNRNNGVMDYYDVPDEMITRGNCICFIGNGNGSAGKQIYKKEDFLSSTGNVCGRNFSLNYYSANFIIAIMDKQQDLTNEFSHKNGRTLEKLSKQSLLLPATPSGDPDWDYMESYMKEMEEKAKERLDRLEEMRKQEKRKIDVSGWGEFQVGELFDATRGKSRRMQILEDGDIPLIAAARNNRGIAGTYNIDAEYENSITVSCNGVGCGSTFYHSYPFSITGDAIVLEEKQDMSDYIKQFIASIIDASFTNKYSYEEKCSADKAKNETILLPVTSAGDPDWAYMEQYMREMEEKAKSRIEKLSILRK